jgi:hypothetical protein
MQGADLDVVRMGRPTPTTSLLSKFAAAPDVGWKLTRVDPLRRPYLVARGTRGR